VVVNKTFFPSGMLMSM